MLINQWVAFLERDHTCAYPRRAAQMLKTIAPLLLPLHIRFSWLMLLAACWMPKHTPYDHHHHPDDRHHFFFLLFFFWLTSCLQEESSLRSKKKKAIPRSQRLTRPSQQPGEWSSPRSPLTTCEPVPRVPVCVWSRLLKHFKLNISVVWSEE